VTSAFSKILPWPVRTFVQVTKSLIGARASRPKSTASAKTSASGLVPAGCSW
jgi:hypothetical protein